MPLTEPSAGFDMLALQHPRKRSKGHRRSLSDSSATQMLGRNSHLLTAAASGIPLLSTNAAGAALTLGGRNLGDGNAILPSGVAALTMGGSSLRNANELQTGLGKRFPASVRTLNISDVQQLNALEGTRALVPISQLINIPGRGLFVPASALGQQAGSKVPLEVPTARPLSVPAIPKPNPESVNGAAGSLKAQPQYRVASTVNYASSPPQQQQQPGMFCMYAAPDGGVVGRRPRMSYKCGKCGLPKKGHICKAVTFQDQSTQVSFDDDMSVDFLKMLAESNNDEETFNDVDLEVEVDKNPPCLPFIALEEFPKGDFEDIPANIL